eukprot:10212567-Lingulodinium_polyedra.AAC.1
MSGPLRGVDNRVVRQVPRDSAGRPPRPMPTLRRSRRRGPRRPTILAVTDLPATRVQATFLAQ